MGTRLLFSPETMTAIIDGMVAAGGSGMLHAPGIESVIQAWQDLFWADFAYDANQWTVGYELPLESMERGLMARVRVVRLEMPSREGFAMSTVVGFEVLPPWCSP